MQHASFPDLAGKRAIVTACTAGIGKGVVEALVGQKASVALLSRNMDKLLALKDTFVGQESNIHVVKVRAATTQRLEHMPSDAVYSTPCPLLPPTASVI